MTAYDQFIARVGSSVIDADTKMRRTLIFSSPDAPCPLPGQNVSVIVDNGRTVVPREQEEQEQAGERAARYADALEEIVYREGLNAHSIALAALRGAAPDAGEQP